MRRNLQSRVEVVTPIEAPALRKDLNDIFETQLRDQRNVWDMQPDGRYVQRQPSGKGRESRGCQQLMVEAAEKQHAKATRLRRLRPRAIARRSVR